MDNTSDAMASVKDFINEWKSPSEYVTAHTSGSTGVPKAIYLFKKDMIASAKATNERFGINSSSVLGLPLSVDYIAGKMMCVRALTAECQLYEMPVSNHLRIEREIDLLAVVPSQVDSLLTDGNAPRLVKNIIVGGAPLDKPRIDALCEKGFNAYLTYGMTETCSHVALSNLLQDDGIFKAMPGISFSTDNRNCLVIKAPSFSFGELVTNDIVELIDDDSFRWVGRFDNVINSGGIKISAEELENEISKFVKMPFYIVGCEDDRWGEVPVMVFEGDRSNEQGVIDLLRSHLDHRLCPKRVIAVEALPLTSNGKILRRKPRSD